ncbi:MAG: hypothetical protein K0S66_2510 [Sphingomonas sp.]|nr:hypothetical protein [Sphingomonas sp.]
MMADAGPTQIVIEVIETCRSGHDCFVPRPPGDEQDIGDTIRRADR